LSSSGRPFQGKGPVGPTMNREFFGPNSCVMATVVVGKSSIVAMNLNACLTKDGKRFG